MEKLKKIYTDLNEIIKNLEANQLELQKEYSNLMKFKSQIKQTIMKVEEKMQEKADIINTFNCYKKIRNVSICCNALMFLLNGVMFNVLLAMQYGSFGINALATLILALLSVFGHEILMYEEKKIIRHNNLSNVRGEFGDLEALREYERMELKKIVNDLMENGKKFSKNSLELSGFRKYQTRIKSALNASEAKKVDFYESYGINDEFISEVMYLSRIRKDEKQGN